MGLTFRQRRRVRTARQAGFSLIEVLAAVAVAGVMFAVAVPNIGTALVDARANAGMRAVQSHLRAARDSAISLRRVVEVRFVSPNQVRSVRLDGTESRPLATTILEHGMCIRLTPGLPDTPDAFGNQSAIAFGGQQALRFHPDGTMTDPDEVPISGTVFLGMQQEQWLSARAVTVFGPTGRVRAYRWDSRAWR